MKRKIHKLANKVMVRLFGIVPYPKEYTYPKHDGVFCDLISFHVNKISEI